MKTFKRICIKDYYVGEGVLKLKLERGKEYITSDIHDNEVVVFTNVWGKAPVDVFAGEIVFTKG